MNRRVVCYGDSNTYGCDPRSYLMERYPESIRWTSLLMRYGWEVCNEGENGRSIPRHGRETDRAVQALCRIDADVLTVMLGSNDLLQNPSLSASECSERMEHFLAALLHADYWKRPRKILLIAPPPMSLGAWVSDERVIAVSRCLGSCFERTARLLGINFADAGDWEIDLTFDGVHFSEAGHLAFSKGIHQALSAVFSV